MLRPARGSPDHKGRSNFRSYRVDGKSPLIFLPPLVELSGQQQSERAVEMRLRIIGFEGQRAPVAGERLGVAALALESDCRDCNAVRRDPAAEPAPFYNA